jgi:hypothetical protein
MTDIYSPTDAELDEHARNYNSLHNVLNRAYLQASEGKGKERHAGGQPFEDQPMQTISGLVGSPDGLAFQAIKKIGESQSFEETPRRVAELLGAINYVAGLIIYLEDRDED